MKLLCTCIALCVVLSACAKHTEAVATSGPPNLLAAVRQRHTLIVATDGNYAPQSFRKINGDWVGFDVDVAREVSKRLGVVPQFENSNYDAVTAGDWHNRWDVNVESMAVTTARKKTLLLTAPYYFVPAAFVVNRDSDATSVAQLKGARVGVGIATTYLSYLDDKLPGDIEPILVKRPSNVKAVQYVTDELALEDLELGNGKRLDAVLTAMPTASAAISAGAPLRIIPQPVFYEDDAIAIDRHSENSPVPLLAAIDDAISEMSRDGTLSRLSKKYYGADLTHKH